MLRARSRVVILGVLALASGLRPWAEAPTDPLWLAAAEASRRAKAWSPGEMRLSIELGDEKGRRLETWEYRYRFAADGEADVSTELLSALHNGEDITAKEREAQARRGATARGGRPSFAGIEDPFDPSLEQEVTVRTLDERKVIDGRLCVSYEFRVKRRDGGFEGTAWLEQATGVPVELSYRLARLPVGLRQMDTTVRYGGPAGEALPVRVDVEGSGAVLLLKRTFRSTVLLGGYWKRSPVAVGVKPRPDRA